MGAARSSTVTRAASTSSRRTPIRRGRSEPEFEAGTANLRRRDVKICDRTDGGKYPARAAGTQLSVEGRSAIISLRVSRPRNANAMAWRSSVSWIQTRRPPDHMIGECPEPIFGFAQHIDREHMVRKLASAAVRRRPGDRRGQFASSTAMFWRAGPGIAPRCGRARRQARPAGRRRLDLASPW